MAKKVGEAFAMSEEDEFVETDEGGSDGSGEGSDSTGETGTDGDSDGATGSEGSAGSDGSASGDDKGGSEGEGSEGEGAEGEGEEGKGEGELEAGTEEGDSGDEGGEGTEKGEGTGEGTEGSGEAGKGEGEGGEGESGEEEDFFADLSTEADNEGGEKPSAVSFKKLGSALDIELESDSEEENKEKINAKIDAAEQDVDLTKFNPEAKRLVKHLNDNGGKIGDFFINPKITTYQSVLNLSAEEKYRTVRRSELAQDGGTKEEIDQEITEQLSNMPAQEIVRIATKIDDDVNKMIAAEINEIVGESEIAAEKNQAEETKKVSKRRENLKNYVQKQDNFLGLKLSDKAKQTISKDIETGRFEEVVDLSDDEVRFAAYMFKRQGSKIGERFMKELAERGRDGYNKGISKSTDKLHKNKTGGQGTRTGHAEGSEGAKNFDNWGGMDL